MLDGSVYDRLGERVDDELAQEAVRFIEGMYAEMRLIRAALSERELELRAARERVHELLQNERSAPWVT